MADEIKRQTDALSSLAEAADRRRPGRPKAVAPNLLPLLRKPLPEEAEAEAILAADALADVSLRTVEDGSGHDLDAARGILVGLLLSLPLWAIILVTVNLIF